MPTDERCIEGLAAVPGEARRGVLTIGNFDGVHVGHREILRAARALGDADGVPVAAMTFEPPPNQLLRPDDPPQRLLPAEERTAELRRAGADWVIVARTDAALLGQSAEQFVERAVVAAVAPRHVVEGPSFLFGRGRSGTVDTLRAAGREAGFDVHVIEPVAVELADGPKRVSSTLIRSLLLGGRVEDAARCLGRAFALYGEVVRGARRGTRLGFPTVNLAGGGQIVPADGVYAGRAAVAGRAFAAAVSIGRRPTFPDGRRAVEAFLLDAEGAYYGQRVALHLLRRLREQIRFESPEALRAQIDKDVAAVRRVCREGRSQLGERDAV